MQPQKNPARILLGLHGDRTEGLLLKNLYCLECSETQVCENLNYLIQRFKGGYIIIISHNEHIFYNICCTK